MRHLASPSRLHGGSGLAMPVMSQMPEDFSMLLRYWRGKRAARSMPRRANIDPTELPGRLWPRLMLLDVVREENRNRFRYRLVGGDVQAALGRNTTGEYLDEATPNSIYRNYVIKIPNDVVEEKRPLYTVNVLTLPGQSVPMKIKRLTLPLSDNDRTVNMTLSAHIYEYRQGKAHCLHTEILAFEELVREFL
jgi:hypothetical protein